MNSFGMNTYAFQVGGEGVSRTLNIRTLQPFNVQTGHYAHDRAMKAGDALIEVTEHEGAICFAVRVQPRGSRNAIEGEWQGALKVRLTAPPVDDKANEALCKFLAEQLNIPRSAVRILAGERSRLKRVEIRGVTVAQIRSLAKEGADH